MKWKNHLDIANAISAQLCLPSELRQVFRQGSIEPDREADKVVERDIHLLLRRRRVRHHRPSKRFVRKLLWKAREAHIEGREEDALWCLGRALHYVQDRSVSTGLFGRWHDRREARIGRIPVQLEAIELGDEVSSPSPTFIDLCLGTLSPKRGAIAAMHQACMLSSAIASAVMSDTVPSRARIKELERSERRHLQALAPLAAVMASSALFAGVWSVQPLLALSSLPLAIIAVALEKERRRSLREARWFVDPGPRGKHLATSFEYYGHEHR